MQEILEAGQICSLPWLWWWLHNVSQCGCVCLKTYQTVHFFIQTLRQRLSKISFRAKQGKHGTQLMFRNWDFALSSVGSHFYHFLKTFVYIHCKMITTIILVNICHHTQQHSIIHYSYHAAYYIPRTRLLYKWKFVTFDPPHSFCPPLNTDLWQLSISSLYLSLVFYVCANMCVFF